MSKEAIKKLGIINKYLSLQVSLGNCQPSVAKDIRKFIGEVLQLEKPQTQAA